MLTKDKSFCVLHNEIIVFTYLVFYIVYKYKNGARIVRIQYFTNTQKVITGMEFLSGVYYLPVRDLFGERSMILDLICSLLIFD